MKQTRVAVIDNPVDYRDSDQFQSTVADKRIADEADDSLLLLEHSPCITMGRSARIENVLRAEADLKAEGVALVKTPRGGDVTFHGPGQLVAYPILKLDEDEADVRQYVRNLERTAALTLSEWDIDTYLRDGMIGLWTEHGKIAAVGVKIRRWTTSHGICINVSVDLSSYNNIVPCGLADEAVTSMLSLLGPECPGIDEVRSTFCKHFAEVFNRSLIMHAYPALPDEWTA